MNSDTETNFNAHGSLNTPGPIGRLVRLLLAGGCLYYVWQLINPWSFWVDAENLFSNTSIWIPIIFALYLAPYVINIGWRINTKRLIQFVIILVSAGLIAFSYFKNQSINSYALNLFTIIWVIYIFTHLGVSFLVSALISTPGCEMRSLPHLWSIITGQNTYEHVCPGPLHKIDLWEQKKNEQWWPTNNRKTGQSGWCQCWNHSVLSKNRID